MAFRGLRGSEAVEVLCWFVRGGELMVFGCLVGFSPLLYLLPLVCFEYGVSACLQGDRPALALRSTETLLAFVFFA